MKNNKYLMPFLMAAAFVFVTIAGIKYEQSFLLRFPLYISLVIALLQSKVSRYALLLGGINSIIYAAVYAYYHLYASAAYALVISCPFQIVSFVLWSKKPWKDSTILKSLTAKSRIIITVITIVLWYIITAALSASDAKFREVDTAVTVLGIVSTILTMLSYYEYTAVMLAGTICTIILYILMLKDNPEQITYLVFSVYSLICTLSAFKSIHILYKEQRREKQL